MRAFVLCTGRCGSMTFVKACEVIGNYTSGHETQAGRLDDRLVYPDRHIEVDNRLSWFLGGLGERYCDQPVYVHLTRDPNAVARSYARRFNVHAGIMSPCSRSILTRQAHREDERLPLARLYVRTVKENIEAFLGDKSTVVRIPIEQPHHGFDRMWRLLDATGDRDMAHSILSQKHNAGRS